MQEWLAREISILEPGLLVIGREVETDFGGLIDLLCIDTVGTLVIVELKRDRTPRGIIAQALDYASWVAGLSNERVTSIADAYLGADGLEQAFRERFGVEPPETLNSEHRLLIVGSSIDPSSERIIRYLSEAYGVNINAATFQYFREPDGSELLARVFLIEPSQAELHTRTRGASKRRPNLSYEQLSALAADAGVDELYEHAVAALEPLLQKNAKTSSIGFAGLFNGSKKTVISLLPGRSSADEGLRYQLYTNRFGELAGLSGDEVEKIVPAQHDDWSFDPKAGPDWQGFQGFIVDREEIDRIARALTKDPTHLKFENALA